MYGLTTTLLSGILDIQGPVPENARVVVAKPPPIIQITVGPGCPIF